MSDDNLDIDIFHQDIESRRKVMNDEVQMLGGVKLYKLLDKTLRGTKELSMQFEPFLAGEQYKLYKWREAYFREHFPREVLNISEEEYSMEVLPYQITKNWRNVVEASCSRPKRSPHIGNHLYGYFGLSNEIMCLFNPDVLHFKESEFDEIHFGGLIQESIHDLNHMLVALFSKTPQSLVYLALKVCAANSLDLSEMPLTVQKKSRCFWRNPTIPPDHLIDEGLQKWKFFRRRRSQLADEMAALGRFNQKEMERMGLVVEEEDYQTTSDDES